MAFGVRGSNQILDTIDRDLPGYEVFYTEDTGNQTYTTAEITREAHYFEISNTGASDLTIEINGDGTVYTIKSNKGFGALGKRDKIELVEILATDTFTLLIRE